MTEGRPAAGVARLLVSFGLLVVAWGVLTGLVVAVGEAIVHSGAARSFDRQVTATVVAWRSPALDNAMKVVTWFGSWVSVVVAAAVLAALAVLRRLPVVVVPLGVLAWAGETTMVTIGKETVQRPRPPHQLWLVTAHGWSFPSGHAGTATLVGGVLAGVVFLATPRRPVRAAAVGGAVVLVGLTAFSRVALGVHWATDIIGGVIAVCLWLTLLGALGHGLAPTRSR